MKRNNKSLFKEIFEGFFKKDYWAYLA